MNLVQKLSSIIRFLLLPFLVILILVSLFFSKPLGQPLYYFGVNLDELIMFITGEPLFNKMAEIGSGNLFFVFFPFILVFGIVPVLDVIFPKYTRNASLEEEKGFFSSKIFDYMVYLVVLIQVFAVFAYLQLMQQFGDQITPIMFFGWTLTLGLACGILGINVGHELGHRQDNWERFLGKILLWSSLRMTFYIEHNWGHHAMVSTPEDPASAEKGENVWTFAPKSIFLTWLNGWKIQKDLLKKRKVGFFSIYNDVFWYAIIQWGTIFAFAYIFGAKAALGFVGSALIGMFLLEFVNYIEHYGLRREKRANGSYERTLPIHSWNSNHSFSGAALYNLSRHSDHHFIASRPYQVLRNYDSCPNMPLGYAGMIVLAWIPPLWFAVMDPLVEEVKGIDKKAYKSELTMAGTK